MTIETDVGFWEYRRYEVIRVIFYSIAIIIFGILFSFLINHSYTNENMFWAILIATTVTFLFEIEEFALIAKTLTRRNAIKISFYQSYKTYLVLSIAFIIVSPEVDIITFFIIIMLFFQFAGIIHYWQMKRKLARIEQNIDVDDLKQYMEKLMTENNIKGE